MRKVIWRGADGEMSDGTYTMQLAVAPLIPGLNYSILYYEDANKFIESQIDGEYVRHDLTPLEQTLVEEYIDGFDWTLFTKHGVGANGEYLGQGVLSPVMVDVAPPVKGYHLWDGLQWNLIHAVDPAGNYVGSVPFHDAFEVVPSAPPTHNHTWFNGEWLDVRPLSDKKNEMLLTLEHTIDRKLEDFKHVGIDNVLDLEFAYSYMDSTGQKPARATSVLEKRLSETPEVINLDGMAARIVEELEPVINSSRTAKAKYKLAKEAIQAATTYQEAEDVFTLALGEIINA